MLEERVKKYVEELHRTIKEHVVYHASGGVGQNIYLVLSPVHLYFSI